MKKSHIATLLVFFLLIPATLFLGTRLPGLPQQGFGFFLHLCKPCLPTGERSLVRAVILGAQVLQFVQVLHLRGRHGQLLERRAQGRHGAGQLLFLRLRGLGRLLRIIQRDLPDVAVSLGY